MKDISIQTWDHRAFHMSRKQFLDALRDETLMGSWWGLGHQEARRNSKRQKEHALCAKAPLRPRLLADAGASRLRRDSVSPQQIVSVMLEAQR